MITKNRNRNPYTFANINLLGSCNADCYFCLGKDIAEKIDCENQANIHFAEWKNFNEFVKHCQELNIQKIYLTGQNIDSLQYEYFDELRDHLQGIGFFFGIRTNGYLLEEKLSSVLLCNDEIGLTINSLVPETNAMIMRRLDLPNWETTIPQLKNCRVSLIPNRYNIKEMMNMIEYVSRLHKNVKYIQIRRISTDTRLNLLAPDIEIFEQFYNEIKNQYSQDGEFNLAQKFIINQMPVYFWRTVETNVNSINYFTNGVISDEYFIVEGYLKNEKMGE
jgi:MoaA/NifB/PqqE/SkfB family radical SAM enzyme